jgi:hypothetical protein
MKKFKNFLFIVLISFFVNVTIPFFYSNHFSQANAAAETKSQIVETTRVLICTIEGSKWVEVETKRSTTSHKSSQNSNQCPSCYISAKIISNTFNNNAPSLINPVSTQESFYIEFEDQVYHQINLLSHQSRAPPYQV